MFHLNLVEVYNLVHESFWPFGLQMLLLHGLVSAAVGVPYGRKTRRTIKHRYIQPREKNISWDLGIKDTGPKSEWSYLTFLFYNWCMLGRSIFMNGSLIDSFMYQRMLLHPPPEGKPCMFASVWGGLNYICHNPAPRLWQIRHKCWLKVNKEIVNVMERGSQWHQ